MSPASQGNLEVEHYIGSNLISSFARVNNSRNNGKGRKQDGGKIGLQRGNQNSCNGGDVYHHRHGGGGGGSGGRQGYSVPPNILPHCPSRNNNLTNRYGAAGWTGIPLISVDDGKKKNLHYQDRTRKIATEDDSTLRIPLSRLAIHTQGAPLILSGRCGYKNQNRGNQTRDGGEVVVVRRSNKFKDNVAHRNAGTTSDCLSVASDESSGSGQSENCLPRIIKPRKRRKKDRKPSIPSSESYEENGGDKIKNSTSSSSSSCAKTRSEPVAVVDVGKNYTPKKCDNTKTTIINGSQTDDGGKKNMEDESHGPKLHHAFEDVTESDLPSYGCLPSSCQCHYCDPSGIWNAPTNIFFKETENLSALLLTPPYRANKTFHPFPHSELVLRRSWSEPISDVARRDDQDFIFSKSGITKDHHWSGDKMFSGSWETIEKIDSDPEKTNKKKTSYGNQCLEVSTEIVTSHNGHRDIEIRFYSSSPTS
ncbi:hypothetical protein Phum_PHUM129570 [Pediculus humanus corporis]|uniref:Uncharacterized protein n=1 Tax=Pediculus humanus subsp. corporis TaxID=121224 RepID=E0VEB7_PEDHC|nr:uncharacterized protein Phum_PHUM129570 [Pediculus humanus corporis]EEB11723.1 hypothetical protein Phum_PHUM129570 [Pediculus humanus corporis]